MLLAYFMNAAIDQECEKYIFDNKLEKEIERKIKDIYTSKGIKRPVLS
jgi:methylmalonyl-CoA mutase